MPDVGAPLYSVSQLTTPKNSFADDVAQLARTGATGIGIFEAKLPPGDDAAARETLAHAGLAATLCIPALWTILPSRLVPEPADPARRLDLIRASIRRLAPFGPVAYLVTAGAIGERDRAGALALVTRNLAAIADAAAEVGGTVGLEPIRIGAGSTGPLVNTLAEAVRMIEDVGPPERRDRLRRLAPLGRARPGRADPSPRRPHRRRAGQRRARAHPRLV